MSGKPKEELGEKKHEIDKRLDVTGQLSTKKGKKGKLTIHYKKIIFFLIGICILQQILKLLKLVVVHHVYQHLVLVAQIQIRVLPVIQLHLVIQVILNMVSDYDLNVL